MPAIILYLFRFIRLLGSGHQAVAVENLALRLQLAAYKRKRKRPVLTEWDRLFWVGLSQVWSGWRHALIFVGGEPLLAFETIKYTVDRAKELAAVHDKNLQIVICTQLNH
jgi:hypothetical protein